MTKIVLKNRMIVLIMLSSMVLTNCNQQQSEKIKNEKAELPKFDFNIEQAVSLAQLPLRCISQEYPNKLSQTLGGDNDLGNPQKLHPAFYGCFDWHSSVHGHWMLVKLLKLYPEVEIR